MSIFSKLGEVFGRKKNELPERLSSPLEKAREDLRAHERHVIHRDNIAWLKLDSGAIGNVKDVSYGGIAVEFKHENIPSALADDLRGELVFLDRSVSCRLVRARAIPEGGKIRYAGFYMIHESAETLIFLRELIEPLRSGRSMLELNPSMCQERLRGPEWTCYRGDGPTDLIIKTRPSDQAVEEAFLTFRMKEGYAELTFQNGKLKTSRADGSGSIYMGNNMLNTDGVDHDVLRQAVFILLGAPASARETTLPLLIKALHQLDYPATAA